MGFVSALRLIAELCKVKITFFVSLTAALGYILGAYTIDAKMMLPVLGIFLLACGASALNQVQESASDKLMERTKNRPIPSGAISRTSAFIISAVIIFSGIAVMYFGTNFESLFFALMTLAWYNGVYTPLKKITPFAIIPGSLVGALPPVSGWLAAGGNLNNPAIWMVALYFFVWQIPHFWILVMIYGKDYEKGGYPTLMKKFNTKQLLRITFNWILAVIAVALILPVANILNYTFSAIPILALSIWFLYESVKFLRSDGDHKKLINTFVRINIYTLMIIVILSFDKLIKIF
ncbi:heme o synthase [soil metagenome]